VLPVWDFGHFVTPGPANTVAPLAATTVSAPVRRDGVPLCVTLGTP